MPIQKMGTKPISSEGLCPAMVIPDVPMRKMTPVKTINAPIQFSTLCSPLTCSDLTTVSCCMTSSCLILTVGFVFNGYRITVGPENVNGQGIDCDLSKDRSCGQ